jgi:hypothetical protein
MRMKLLTDAHETLNGCAWNSQRMRMKLPTDAHETLNGCAWNSQRMRMEFSTDAHGISKQKKVDRVLGCRLMGNWGMTPYYLSYKRQ